MTARLLDGEALARPQRAEHGLVPGLAVVLVGDDPASRSCVRGKRKAAAEEGMRFQESRFAADLPQAELAAEIERRNAVSPGKDVDGLHPVDLGHLLRGQEGFLPCTPHGVKQILMRSGVEVAGKHVVMVGRSALVGRPLANTLTQKAPGANATAITPVPGGVGPWTIAMLLYNTVLAATRARGLS